MSISLRHTAGFLVLHFCLVHNEGRGTCAGSNREGRKRKKRRNDLHKVQRYIVCVILFFVFFLSYFVFFFCRTGASSLSFVSFVLVAFLPPFRVPIDRDVFFFCFSLFANLDRFVVVVAERTKTVGTGKVMLKEKKSRKRTL